MILVTICRIACRPTNLSVRPRTRFQAGDAGSPCLNLVAARITPARALPHLVASCRAARTSIKKDDADRPRKAMAKRSRFRPTLGPFRFPVRAQKGIGDPLFDAMFFWALYLRRGVQRSAKPPSPAGSQTGRRRHARRLRSLAPPLCVACAYVHVLIDLYGLASGACAIPAKTGTQINDCLEPETRRRRWGSFPTFPRVDARLVCLRLGWPSLSRK